MHKNEELITKFYSSFQKLDHEGMNACYHDDVAFSDPVFKDLKGWRAKAMWRMLCERAQDFTLEFRDVKADDSSGSAYWEPTYKFSKTGNTIVNKINARFEFKDGKIIKHTDSFSLYRWARMALGLQGVLLGWTPMVQNKIRGEANTGLEMFIKRKKLAPT
ncbi:MAG: nuclear transport factor 2 family protein [Spirochaetales bacterium]|nr:nuclear transport factor 2 family protein [Leptospiraceae bacterium]MCP5483844.1 nuclear transport factor 2 family protein [Spirochaetales bacterium]MCP5486863.1 nuclear transport factor 2 family protein [Spirochaetales bacterium]